ncbi:Quinol monooxygenase YgiN [Mucilaginibacter pineti]|uniref:Quinol monooxygenase YgiN n=1 Tax=Mucilaginibacter pineti TaxID=1391627 RepID=A0A1G7JJ92_9SPHI|nr:hypothetical protein [Mucilaginibacter pineti]SDF24935.1 Quinol monooxygenase YgiN [Mucilaginibacter pineti]
MDNLNKVFDSQPGSVIKMKANPGKGSALLTLTTKLFAMSEAIDRWLIFKDDADPDTLWFFETFKNEDAVLRHQENRAVQEGHDEVMALLAEPPLHVAVHTVATN